jgi:hypothetical protein
VEEGG